MVHFTATILKFAKNGEKTGWSYIEISKEKAGQIKPGYSKSFRVKGRLDAYVIRALALWPAGNGDFILPLNATIRKAIKKQTGDQLEVRLEAEDENNLPASPEFNECLADEPAALAFFHQLAKSHQRYYLNWIESAKTDQTKTKRIGQAIDGLARGFTFGEMIKNGKKYDREL